MNRKPACLGIFTALAMILSYLESLLPFFFGVPGIKLGLANSLSLSMLYLLGIPAAWMVSITRIVLTGFLFGSLFSVIYSLAGAVLSLCVMAVLKKSGRFSVTGVSAAGGMTHNMGQLFAAALIAENAGVFYYAPVLLLAGLLAGTATGLLSAEILRRLPGTRFFH